MRFEVVEMQGRPGWARPDSERVAAPFGGAWPMTVQKLEHEAGAVDARLIVVQVTGPRVEVRRDGNVSARSVLDPPVVVELHDTTHGTLLYRSDRYDRWHSNVHAAALTLERLRAVERYGCAGGGEQYSGWAQLPAARVSGVDEEALSFLVEVSGLPRKDGSRARRPGEFYAAALKKTHPDVGGDHETFLKVQEAARVLGMRGGR